MKNIVTLVVFAIIIAFSAGSVVAESNPLLTVFDGIKVGMEKRILVESMENLGITVYTNQTKLPEAVKPVLITTVWWNPMCIDNPFSKFETSAHNICPYAALEVEIDSWYTGKVIRAKYTYKFLEFGREIRK